MYESIFFAVAVICYMVAATSGVVQVVRPLVFPSRFPRLLTLVGFIAGSTALGIHCGTTEQPPFSRLYEILALTACSLALLFLLVSLWLRHEGVAAFCLPVVAGLALSALFFSASSSPRELFPGIEEIERSPAFVVHILAALMGYAAFIIVVAAGVMYLVQDRHLKVKLFGRLFDALPSLETLEKLGRDATSAGVILFAISLALGTAMAESSGALGTRWLQRPKIFLALLTLAAFAALAVAQRVGRLRGRTSAALAVVAFFFAILTVFLGHLAAEDE